MKKLFAILMALCLMLSCAALAEATELNWADFEGGLADLGLAGEFVTFDEIAVKIWIPESMQAVELTDEDVENGYIGYFSDDEASLGIVYADVNGMSIEDYAATVAGIEGVTEVEQVVVNGLPAISYQMPENDTLNVAFATEAGYVLEVTMYPVSAEGAELAWSIVTASIQEA